MPARESVDVAYPPVQNHFFSTAGVVPRGRLHLQAFVPHENRAVFERRGACIVLLGYADSPDALPA